MRIHTKKKTCEGHEINNIWIRKHMKYAEISAKKRKSKN